MNTRFSHRFLLLFFINSIFFSCQNPNTHEEPPYTGAPKQIISVQQAQRMYDAYTERRVPIIQRYEDSIAPDSKKFTPTRYAEYDLETIKQYIAFIEHEAKAVNVDIKTLRFYLSNYPNSDTFPNGENVKYPRRNSFFVVPTMTYEGKNVGFSIEEVDGKYIAAPITRRTPNEEKQQDKRTADSTGQMNEAGFFMLNAAAQESGSTSLILNDSQITPPPGTSDFGNNN